MDRAGSSLPDVQDMILKSSGRAEFSVDDADAHVSVTLFQPVQATPDKSQVARRLSQAELYVTNLLPFRVARNWGRLLYLNYLATQPECSDAESESFSPCSAPDCTMFHPGYSDSFHPAVRSTSSLEQESARARYSALGRLITRIQSYYAPRVQPFLRTGSVGLPLD